MTKTNAKPGKPGRAGPALILFGRSEDGKPRAGTFQEGEIETATKASAGMGLAVLKVSDAQAHDLATKIPAGRVHANGRGFVPFIRGNLYAQLQDLAKAQGIDPTDRALNGESNSETPAAPAHGKSGPEQRLPKSWDDIAVGNLVLAQETDPKDGWWEATVIKKSGDMYTLKWRQTLQRRNVLRHKFNLAPIWPGDDPNVKPLAIKEPVAMYPVSWQAIDLNHLVLAKEEGPMEQWWEANPIDAHGDSFTLRWRDYPAIPTIVRPRLGLALIHPNPATASAETTAVA
jgi:hypothetical protein